MVFQSIAVASGKGGVAKTTLTALLAMAAARRGRRVTAVDLDPRATLTKLLGAADKFKPGFSSDAILAATDPSGWAAELRVPSTWHENLGVLPAERSLGNREKGSDDYAEHRLAMSLKGLETDLVIVDTPPRPGGLLIQSALHLEDVRVLYAATPDQDGLDGVAEGWETVDKAKTHGNPSLETIGVALSRVNEQLVDVRRCRDELLEIYGDLVLRPFIPERVMVREARAACEWVGHYEDVVSTAVDMLWQALDKRLYELAV
jgi:chromosome partitioning protein